MSPVVTATTPLSDRRWYRITHWCFATGALVATLYFFASYRGWVPGDRGPLSSLLLMASLTANLWALLGIRRFDKLALVLQSVSAGLLVWSIVSMGRGN